MTSTISAQAALAYRPATWQRVLAAVAVLSCVPYAALKLMWLFGSDIGLNDDQMVGNTAMDVANLLTLAMSLSGAALSVAMIRPSGVRLPTWIVLPPIFVGSGLLGGILLLIPAQLMLGAPGSQQPDSAENPIAGWTYAVAYGGFAVLGICLLALSAEYSRRRWLTPDGWTTPLRTWPPVITRRRTLAVSHVVFMVVICVAEALVVGRAGAIGGHQIVAVTMSVACLIGTVALAARRPGDRVGTLPVLASFVGSAAVASWGLFFFVILVVPNPLVDGGTALPSSLIVIEAVKAINGALTLLVIHRLRPADPARLQA